MTRAGPRATTSIAAEGRTVRAPSKYRNALGRLSRRSPPAIVRPEVGEEIRAEELRAAFEPYRTEVCRHYENTPVRTGISEDALATAPARSASAREDLNIMEAELPDGGIEVRPPRRVSRLGAKR